MKKLLKTPGWFSKAARHSLEIALIVTVFILMAVIAVTLAGGLVTVFILGWRAIIALVVTGFLLVVLEILFAIALIFLIGLVEEDSEAEWGI